MSSTLEPRAVRVGIIQGGRLVEERLIRHPRQITVGCGPRSTFVVPSDALPGRWPLLERQGRRYRLQLARGMEARIADRAQVVSLGVDSPRALALPEAARGRVAVGDVVLLFQLVPPPPIRPRPQLPRSLRASAWTRLDRPFAVVAVLSLLTHLGLVLHVRSVDWPRTPNIEEVPSEFVRVFRIPPPPKPAEVAPAAQTATSSPSRPAAPSRARQPTVDERRARLLAQMRANRLILALTARGEPGSVVDLIERGAVDRDQEEAFRNVGGLSVASDPGLRPSLSTEGTGRISAPSDLRGVGRIAVADVGPSHAERRVGVVRSEPPQLDEPTAANPAELARLIRSRLVDIRLCYERALKRRPELAGKLIVRFTLAAAGTVSAVEVDDETLGDAEVAACVRAAVARWRFPPPAKGGVEVSFPFVFQPAA